MQLIPASKLTLMRLDKEILAGNYDLALFLLREFPGVTLKMICKTEDGQSMLQKEEIMSTW